MQTDQAARPIIMYRDDLASIPSSPLPQGYSLRGYRQGDEPAWTRIQAAADRYNAIGPDLFYTQFDGARDERERRILFLEAPSGEPIGTAAAWMGTDGAWEGVGRVHWIAITPEHQGRGLAKPLLSALLIRLRELGHRSAYLTTSSARVPALALYRSYGFNVAQDR